MKYNKKAEGTASSYLIASIIFILVLLAVGVTVNSFASQYGAENIEYFEEYGDIGENITFIAGEFAGDYDYRENSSNPINIRTEDNLFWRSFKVVDNIPSLSGSVVASIDKVSYDLGIPPEWTTIIAIILVVLLIVLVVKVIRGINFV